MPFDFRFGAKVFSFRGLTFYLQAPTELTAELLNALIEKILIHEAVKNPDGTKDQEIEIYYRFIGKVE